MKNTFRIIASEILPTSEIAEGPVRVVDTLWEGQAEPDSEIIDTVKTTLQLQRSETPRSPFNQLDSDTFYVQRRRSIAFLGWKTLDAINIYSE